MQEENCKRKVKKIMVKVPIPNLKQGL